jgi:hypothetical protein
MTRGQIAQLQELSKCWNLPRYAEDWVHVRLSPFWTDRDNEKMHVSEKAQLRRLMHQYRGQIAAMKRNRGKA